MRLRTPATSTSADAAARLDERGRGDEPGELVHGEQGAGHGRGARHARVGRVAHDGVEHVLGVAERAQVPHALGRVLGVGGAGVVGEALVVEVVHEPARPQRASSAPRRRA
jgi:hypothetical protein